jgi:hypothetical protein
LVAQARGHTEREIEGSETMSKIAVMLLADTDTHEAMGRMANALTLAKEGKEAGDDVRLVLDGAGTKWAAELSKDDHKYHRLFEDVRDEAGACVYCARAYGVKDAVAAAGIEMLDEYKGHPSVRQLISDGYEVVSF